MPNRRPSWYENSWVLMPATLVIVTAFLWRSCISEAQAQTVVTFKLMPPGHDGQVQGVGQARYYLLEEYLQLAEFDAELVKLRLDVQAYQGVERALTSEVGAKEKIILSLESDKKILTERGLRLEENWKKCEDELIDAHVVWPYVVGAVGAAVGIFGLGMWLGSQ